MSVYVVTKVENRNQITRVVLGCSAAHQFLAWLVANGNLASIKMQDQPPHRAQEEMDRAIALCERWFNDIPDST